MTLNPGSSVVADCDRVGNFPFSILKDKSSLKTDPGNVEVKHTPPLSRKAGVIEQAFIANELIICALNFSPIRMNELLKAELRIEPPIEPPPPPPVPVYSLWGWVRPHFFIVENAKVFECLASWEQWFSTGSGTTWNLTGCSPSVAYPSRCNGYQYTATAGYTVNTGNFNPATGEVTGPMLTRFATVVCKLAGQVSFNRSSDRNTESITHPMVRCPNAPYPYVWTSAAAGVSMGGYNRVKG